MQVSARSMRAPPEVTVKRSINVKAKKKDKTKANEDAFNWPISFHDSGHPWVIGAGRNLVRDGGMLSTKMDIFQEDEF